MFPNGPVQTMLIRFLSVWSPKPLLFTHTSQFHYQAVVGQIFQYDIKRRVINAMVHRLFTNILPDHWFLCLEQSNYFALDFGVVAMKYLLRIWCPMFCGKYWKFNKHMKWKKGDPEIFVAAQLRYCSHDHGPMWRRLLVCGFLSCFAFFYALVILCQYQCQFNCGKHVIPTAWPRCLVVSSMKTVLSLFLSHFIK